MLRWLRRRSSFVSISAVTVTVTLPHGIGLPPVHTLADLAPSLSPLASGCTMSDKSPEPAAPYMWERCRTYSLHPTTMSPSFASASPLYSCNGRFLITSRGAGSIPATPVPPLSVAELVYTPESAVDVSASAASSAEAWEGDMLVLTAFQQEDKEAFAAIAGAAAEAADEKLGGAAQDIIATQEFKVGGEGGGGKAKERGAAFSRGSSGIYFS